MYQDPVIMFRLATYPGIVEKAMSMSEQVGDLLALAEAKGVASVAFSGSCSRRSSVDSATGVPSSSSFPLLNENKNKSFLTCLFCGK